jgi:hypothetical protein
MGGRSRCRPYLNRDDGQQNSDILFEDSPRVSGRGKGSLSSVDELAFAQARYDMIDAVDALVVDDVVAFGLDVGHSGSH